MQRKNPRAPKAGWRKSTRQAVPASGSTPEFGVRGRSRRKRLFQLTALASLALMLGLFLILKWLEPLARDVPLIVAAVTTSSDDCFIPVSPFALQDVQLWKQWFEKEIEDDNQHVVFQGRVAHRTGKMVDNSGAGGLISHLTTQGIRGATPGGPGGNMLALSLIAPGLVDQNEPYLLVGDSRPEDKSSWVSVADLLQKIYESLKEKGSSCKAVLFLDAGRAGTAWDWGKLDHSFSASCQEKAVDYSDRLAIIVSCGDQERSWWDPVQGHSLFARAILQAFAGNDTVDSDGSNIITVGEIEAFLRTRVSNDARSMWAASQHPRLLSDKPEIKAWKFIKTPSWPENLSQDESALQIDKTALIDKMQQQFDVLDGLWERHNALQDESHSPLVTDPLLWSILEKRLARLDQLAMAGRWSDFRATKRTCEMLLNGFEAGPAAVNSKNFPELRLREYFHTPAPSGDDELETVFQEWSKKADVNVDPFEMKDDPDRETKLASKLWRWLLDNPNRSTPSVTIANELLVNNDIGVRASAPLNLLETHLMRLLADEQLSRMEPASTVRVLRLHDQSRDTLFPNDIRASFWIRSNAKKYDCARMTLIDGILGDEASAVVEDQLSSVNRTTNNLKNDGQVISDAYRWRDNMMHDVPRIAETLLADEGAFAVGEQQVALLLEPATKATRRLKQSLRFSDMASDRSKWNKQKDLIKQATDGAQNAMKSLETILHGRADDAIQSSGDAGAKGLRQAVALLAGSGLSHAKRRSGVHGRVIEILRNRTPKGIPRSGTSDQRDNDSSADQTTQSSSESETESETESESSGNSNSLIGGWHPWTYWLRQIHQTSADTERDESFTKSAGSLVKQGESIRSEIKRLQDETFGKLREHPQKQAADGKLLWEVRDEVAALDARLRGELFVLSQVDNQINQATRDRFELDVQLFLMDHAQRTMREFWCDSRYGDERPYFASAAEELLLMDAFHKMQSRTLDGMILGDQLDELRETAKSPDTLLAKSTSQDIELENIRDTTEWEFSFPIPEFLSSGKVSVFGTSKQRDLVNTKLEPCEDSPNETAVAIPVPDSLTKENSHFAVTTFFRGLRRKGGLDARVRGDPDTVVFELPQYGAPTAFVRAQNQHMNTILVFDCSGTMKGKRMEEAKAAINDLINELPDESEVGLILFGSQHNWKTGPDGRVIRQTVNGKTTGKYLVESVGDGKAAAKRWLFPNDRRAIDNPNFDVEKVAAFQPLTDDHRKLLIEQVRLARPFGFTPTYQAINEAYQELGQKSGHIIVLTDGKPYLLDIQPRDKVATGKEFEDAGAESLSIINFANTAAQVDLKTAFPNRIFKANFGELARILKKMIPDENVTWKFPRSNLPASAPEKKFHTTVPIDTWPPDDANVTAGKLVQPSRKFDVTALLGKGQRKTAPVRVEGGEAFQLEWKNNRLSHVPYVDSEKRGTLFDRLNVPAESKYDVFVGRARRYGGTLNVQVVIENKHQQEFTPRPSDIWIDIVAKLPDGNHRYSITIPEFVPREPVPVLQCRINNWPDTDSATIDVWIRMDGSQAERQQIPITDNTPATIGGAEIRVERQTKDGNYQVVVKERYDDPKKLHSLRVLPEPLPERAEIKFYRPATSDRSDAATSNDVWRTFFYKEQPAKFDLWVTEKRQIIQGAIHASDDLHVVLD